MRRTLEDRLIEWEERRERGEPAAAETLCADAPELVVELRRLIAQLEVAARLLDVTPAEGPVAIPAPAVPPAAIGRYELRAELGRGATCLVYRAWDPELRREVALKVLRADRPLPPGDQAAVAARFEREAQTLARLCHDNVVPIYEPGLAEGRPYFVLEYVRGGTLRDRLAALSAAGPRAFVPLLEQVARAVQYAHDQGVLHRDLKPANILLTDDGRPLVSDFGLAKLLADGAADDALADTVPYVPAGTEPSPRLTATGHQPGTPAYMAPEQYDPDFGPVQPATDVWALGVILYEMLTGDRPFTGRTRAEVRQQVCGGRFVRPRRLRGGVDRRLEAVVLRCLETEPSGRYRTAGALADALASAQARRRWPRRLALLLLAGAAAILAAALWKREPPPRPHDWQGLPAQVAALRPGESITLVDPASRDTPPYLLRAGAKGITLARTDDGLTIDGRVRCCLVELCPEVPLRHYSVSARIELTNRLSDTLWGIYVNHTPVGTGTAVQHYFEAAYFKDLAGLPPGGVPPQGPAVVEAALAPRWFSYDYPTRTAPYRNDFYQPPNRQNSVTAPVPPGAKPNSPRTLRFEVHADEVSAQCGGGGLVGELILGTVRPRDREDFLHTMRLDYPDLRGVNPKTLSGTGTGVYVDTGACVVSEFVIEALAGP